MREPTPIERRAAELEHRYPDALTPYWWYIVRPVCKIACLTLVAAPGVMAATPGAELPPLVVAALTLVALAAGYGLSEMSPGFRPDGGRGRG
jgi:hypothetical protein